MAGLLRHKPCVACSGSAPPEQFCGTVLPEALDPAEAMCPPILCSSG